ncbi:MAG: alkyl hydroperoxide reductase AhpD [Phycisphaeraceae bacterium]|nr:MAG: alkyl hydroperoxide reductase AhpD [Phycisphaeraceae bacterium]
MARIAPLTKNDVEGKAADQWTAVEKKLGKMPNMLATLAHSPAALGTYLNLGEALGDASISAGLREQIAVAVAGVSKCGYCASAHTVIGAMNGVAKDELAKNLRGEATDPKVQAALDFSKIIVENRGWASDAELQAVRDAGYTEGEVLEIVATVVANLFTNYMNHVIETENDFPKVELPQAAGV